MSATDELRRMLDELGVEWEADDRQTYTFTYWGDWAFTEPLDAKPHTLGAQCELMLIPATPEQAIAATLGSGREAELQKALNKAAGNWARADAELRKALDFMRIWISDDAHLGESELSEAFEKAEGLRKLDAIESAIAATLGGGKLTAEQVRSVLLTHLPHREYYSVEQTDAWQAIADELNVTIGAGECENESKDGFRCSKCGDTWLGGFNLGPIAFKRCPSCGAKVGGR